MSILICEGDDVATRSPGFSTMRANLSGTSRDQATWAAATVRVASGAVSAPILLS